MAELKYGKYVLQNAIRTELDLPKREQYPFVHIEKEQWKDMDVNCNFACSCVHSPYVMPDLPHSHPFGEFLYFIGSDPDNPEDLGAVVEIGIGEEWQKLTFDKTAVLYFRTGLQHAPVYVKKVDRPFYFGHVMQSSSYAKADEPGENEKATTKVEYGEVIKHPVFKKTDYGTELIFIGKDHDAMDADIYFYTVKKPAVIPQPDETKGYNRFGILMGGDPKKIPDFTAEVEITLGTENETQVIDSTTVFHIPAGIPGKDINFRKVDSPVAFMNIYVPTGK